MRGGLPREAGAYRDLAKPARGNSALSGPGGLRTPVVFVQKRLAVGNCKNDGSDRWEGGGGYRRRIPRGWLVRLIRGGGEEVCAERLCEPAGGRGVGRVSKSCGRGGGSPLLPEALWGRICATVDCFCDGEVR